MESMFGANLGGGGTSSCLQNYGTVATPQGRLLAFPNVFHHRVSGFRLADPTKPCHRRFIALWLVDPQTRIISTANVPPQQAEWWSGALLEGGDDNSAETMLSPDIVQLLFQRGIISESQRAEAFAKRGAVKLRLAGRAEGDGPEGAGRCAAHDAGGGGGASSQANGGTHGVSG